MGRLKYMYFIGLGILVLFSTCIIFLELHSISNGISLSLMFNPSASLQISSLKSFSLRNSSFRTSSLRNSSLRNSSYLITIPMQTKLFNEQVGQKNTLGPHVNGGKHQTHAYTRFSPIVWIGGVPSSGTTLMRVILGTHPSLRCGPETALIPYILTMHATLNASSADIAFIRGAGMSDHVVNSALSSYILELLTKYIQPADVLCSKDPVALNYGIYINQLFPNSKHIFMIRDGRAVVNSIINRMHN